MAHVSAAVIRHRIAALLAAQCAAAVLSFMREYGGTPGQ
jgi:hypothetical protein